MTLSKNGTITVLKPGPFTSIQDAGRYGYAGFGVPSSGFMDASSAGIANLLLGNRADAPCLEIFGGGVRLLVDTTCLLVAAGAEGDLGIANRRIRTHQRFQLEAGDVLDIYPFRSGQWMYLALAGDFSVPTRFGSKSFYYPITPQSKLKSGDVLNFSCRTFAHSPSNSQLKPHNWSAKQEVEVYPGPELQVLTESSQHALFHRPFTVSTTQNRMGIQLVERLENSLPEMYSSPVFPGTVQLTPSGTMIVLMRDAQVTGGYPRILQLTEASISLLAQKRPGEIVTFSLLPSLQVS